MAKATNKGGAIQPIDQAIRDEAQALYLKHWTPSEIAAYLDQNVNTIKKWASRGNWTQIRDGVASEISQDIAKRRTYQINNITKDSFEAIADTIQKYKKAGMSLDDAAKVAKMLTDLDKFVRLAEGKPTEIKEERKIETQVHLQKVIDVLKSDPFTELPQHLKDVNEPSESE